MILVTGGVGFIGSHIVDALLAAGKEPVVLDDFSTSDRANLPAGVEVVEADVADPGVVATISSLRPRAVVHAAAQVSVAASMEDPAFDLAVNVGGTANVLAGARAAGAERFVFLSSGGGIYGEADGADEGTMPRPKSYYGAHKYLAERYVEMDGISYAIARLANVYGPRQRTDLEGGVVAIFAERLREGLPVTINGTGEQSRDFVHVADVVDALLVMADSGLEGTWNVGTGRAVSILELLRVLEAEIRPAVEMRHGPARQGDVRSSRLSIEAIQRDLGCRPGYDIARGVASMT
ncbi:MAG TPA: NAD-dependent epimerase/dehydratase family protein [Rubrobacter sp.]|nr:NAD-dependent epimerase/dehydratase family protein [Rubrobacter sp.]